MAVVALIAMAAACGDDGAPSLEEAQQLLPTPLAAAGTSPGLGAPLPEGAESVPSDEPGTEVFSVDPPVTLSEVNAFFRQEMDGKPFGEFTWCGSEVDEIQKAVVRAWRRSGTDETRTVLVRSTSVDEPTLIVVRQQAGIVPALCSST